MTHTPIACVLFNHPEHTAQTFAVLRTQSPSQLVIIAHGPHAGHTTDVQRSAAVRGIVEQVDWPRKVHRNYADSNMGLKRRVSSGLDWVFSQVERAKRWDALESFKEGGREIFGRIDERVATGLSLSHDPGSQYLADDFQREIAFSGHRVQPLVRAHTGRQRLRRADHPQFQGAAPVGTPLRYG
jgi:hypothetical protein